LFTGSFHGEEMVESENPVEILIAVADVPIRNLMIEGLVKVGCGVVEAKNGKEALEKFLDKRPDAVFLDACLSGMDGFEVCRSIRQGPGGEYVPILMIIECGEDDLILRAFEEGATDFISKPINGTALGHRTRYILRAAQIVRDLRQCRDRRCENEDRLNYLAYHDPLTGLPNRLLFEDRFQHAVAKARRSGRKVAVLFLDLDQFKRINDSLGHDIGDQLLRKVAERIRSGAREEDTLARFGGDEFVLLLEDVTRVNTVGIVAHKVLSSLSRIFEVGGFQLCAAASIGIGIYPDNGQSMEELLRCADIAMYRAKELGRNTLQFYTPEINFRARETLLLESGLRQALTKGELEIYYQPQFDLVSGRMVGAEALLRWNHPERGLLLPMEFLPLAEETGLIFAISDWILQTVCRQNKGWQVRGFPPLVVAVNIATRMFQQRELVQMVDRALRSSGLKARFLELEVTESMIMHNVEAAAQTLEELSRLGVNLAIDDFGTGYSSVSGLRRMPIRRLKIDRAFVNDLTSNPNDATIAASIIALARSMNLGVIAEGVETEEQLRFLKAKGCRQGQGFLFSQPLPEGQLTSLLDRSFPQ
jgi:diguanylate cyclase (GGDEF)-like protein